MASSSSCFVIVCVAVLLQFLLVSSSTKPIDAICQKVRLDDDKAFCFKTLPAYPPAALANSTFQAARAALNLGKSYAEKSVKFIKKAAMEKPKLKKQFMECQKEYVDIKLNLMSAAGELKISPETSNYDAIVCTDNTTRVKDSVGKNRDDASKTIMKMTLMMNKLIAIAVGATVAVGG